MAAVLRRPDAPFVLETVLLPDLAPTQVLVRVAASGFCHTDVRPREPEVWAQVGPVVVGHEGSGVVEAVGSSVTQLRVGDHVVMSFAFCGECLVCLSGSPAYCT